MGRVVHRTPDPSQRPLPRGVIPRRRIDPNAARLPEHAHPGIRAPGIDLFENAIPANAKRRSRYRAEMVFPHPLPHSRSRRTGVGISWIRSGLRPASLLGFCCRRGRSHLLGGTNPVGIRRLSTRRTIRRVDTRFPETKVERRPIDLAGPGRHTRPFRRSRSFI